MSDPLPDQATQTIAVLAACFAKTLGEKDPDFLPAFEQNAKEIYSQIRDDSYFHSETLQAVRLVGDLLKA
jgi:hypothetical protein